MIRNYELDWLQRNERKDNMNKEQVQIQEIDEMAKLKAKLSTCEIEEVEEYLNSLSDLQIKILLKLYVYGARN